MQLTISLVALQVRDPHAAFWHLNPALWRRIQVPKALGVMVQ